MQNIFDTISSWEELIDKANERFIYGDTLETDLFRLCMREAYVWFFVNGETNDFFNKAEEQLYTAICTYSKIEPLCIGEYTPQFKATISVSKDFTKAVKNPGLFRIADRQMTQEYIEDSEVKQKVYDFETGDLKDYLR